VEFAGMNRARCTRNLAHIFPELFSVRQRPHCLCSTEHNSLSRHFLKPRPATAGYNVELIIRGPTARLANELSMAHFSNENLGGVVEWLMAPVLKF
jgi:hypothetical protein